MELPGDECTADAVYPQSKDILVKRDYWKASDASTRLPENATGETIFELLAPTPRASIDSENSPNMLQLPLDAEGDYWELSGTAWTKHHKSYRTEHDHPADGQAGGPDIS